MLMGSGCVERCYAEQQLYQIESVFLLFYMCMFQNLILDCLCTFVMYVSDAIDCAM